jgi:hypothetical protein
MATPLLSCLDLLHAPDWVRRCVALNHHVRYHMSATLDRFWVRWFCTTCGKDRA